MLVQRRRPYIGSIYPDVTNIVLCGPPVQQRHGLSPEAPNGSKKYFQSCCRPWQGEAANSERETAPSDELPSNTQHGKTAQCACSPRFQQTGLRHHK